MEFASYFYKKGQEDFMDLTIGSIKDSIDIMEGTPIEAKAQYWADMKGVSVILCFNCFYR